MRIFYLLCGDERYPGIRERIFKYKSRFEREGHECAVKVVGDVAEGMLGAARHLLKLAREGWNADIIHNYRVSLSPKELAMLKTTGRKIIFELDDAIFADPPFAIPVKRKGMDLERWVAGTVSIADEVIAGNTYLAEWARQYCRRVEIIPTCLDLAAYVPMGRMSSREVTLGWVGMGHNLFYVRQIRRALERVLDRYPDACLKILSDEPLELNGRVVNQRWMEPNQVRDIAAFDIGLMPLTDDSYSRGKCAYKALQYMALKVPPVVSPVGMNCEVVEHGRNGLLASTEEDWVEALSHLIEDSDLRRRLGESARVTVEQKYSEERAWNTLRRIYGLHSS